MAARRFVRTVLILSTVVFVSQSRIEAGTGPAPQLKVTAASFDAAADTLAIYGVNFGATRGVELPIAAQMAKVLHGQCDPRSAVLELMGRKQKQEI